MPRPSRLDERRKELLPEVAKAFSKLGYRQATTAKLAARCGVQENILYRLWRDKKAMFLAAIDYTFDWSTTNWQRVLKEGDGSTAERLIEFEAPHRGAELAGIVFAALGELHDREIRQALSRMYRRYHPFIRDAIVAHRGESNATPTPDQAAWGVIGLGTITNLMVELKLSPRDGFVHEVFSELARLFLEGKGR